jgi:hypothetical protein
MTKKSKVVVSVGDLVAPLWPNEFLFRTPEDAVNECDPMSVVWDLCGVGVVIELREFKPAQEFHSARVIVGGVTGWTFTDYVRVVVKGKLIK